MTLSCFVETYLGQEEHTSVENERPDELDRKRDTVRGVVRAVLGGVVDDGSEQETDGDGPLVAGDDGATDPLGRALRLVHGDHDGDEADTETGNAAAGDEERDGRGSGLHGHAGREDERGKDDTEFTSEVVTDR